MADETLQTKSDSATPKLAAELHDLVDRVTALEEMLRGAESILVTVRDLISYTPAEGDDVEAHRRGYEMIEFLTEQVRALVGRLRADESGWPSETAGCLSHAAEQRRLIRYGEYRPETVA